MKDEVDLLVQEYNNLWQEKLIHKQQLRKTSNMVTYLISMSSLALTILGLSTTDFMARLAATWKTSPEGVQQIVSLVCIPLPMLLFIVLSFTLTELYHIYVIGRHVGELERRLNTLSPPSGVGLAWEHRVCAVAYAEGSGGKKDGGREAVLNLVGYNTRWLLALPTALVTLIASAVAFKTLLGFGFYWLTLLVAAVYAVMIAALIYSGWKMAQYAGAGSALGRRIEAINRQPAKGGQTKD